ncbi:MAG TPA: UDP-N-acetylglucosamine--N-acetylmuramyl-(pentapeptide) pyrophosphoryl-undecaprenol N-acetylglucosamine transferase [Solirubrobacteraceae bacterium]|jgi:UDP-N-acetylglucosamine--N-acetylmuramyl-(pentapeptide) pyrophosphoryl-undecaprenol N-acetylglucosamine transferase|nr:UDP-N-acetylglucosamine--N-acetylmuramyl-(pentapeptide) pyrophosphoryl-undecaprenol N-acetylglucosamine transferase [Solirubrobacteraceae bacterium]
MQKRIAIAAGGTAGHVVPALAVADVLRARGASVFFIGGNRAERDLVPAAGYEFHEIGVEGLSRTNPLAAARGLGRSATATVRARRLLRDRGAQAVMGGGGYVAAPVALAGRTLGLPVVLTEADSHLGLANRALAPLSQRVCLAFALDGRDGERYLVTGRPGPAASVDRAAARASLGVPAGVPCVLVSGGSLGARSINEAAVDAFGQAPFHVVHVTGSRDYPALLGHPRGSHYDIREYLPVAAFSDALAASDLVVGRAGGSVFEIAGHGRPAILIPYPRAAADHQRTNAAWMERAGAAVVIDDADLTGDRLRAEVDRLLGDPDLLAGMAAASASLARPDAAAAVAGELLLAAG